MAFNDQEQAIIKYGVANGKSQQEVQDAITRLRTGQGPVAPTASTPAAKPGLVQRVATDINNRGAANADIYNKGTDGTDQSMLHNVDTGFKLAANTAGGIADTIGELIKSAPGGEQALNAVGGVASAGYNAIVDKLAKTPLFQGAAQNPDATKVLEQFLSIAKSGGDISNNILAADGVAKAGDTVVNLAKTGVDKTVQTVKNSADAAAKDAADLKTQVQTSLSGKNVDPQLKASADRMFMENSKVPDPIASYEEYLTQSQKAIKDIKADPAISSVGEDVGNAFKQVVNQRRQVGKIMGEEIKKVGGVKTDVLPSVDEFVNTLKENGLQYDRVDRALNVVGDTKFSSADLKMIQTYATELQKLGSKPTLSQLDAFISRLPNELDVYKASQGITGTTNAERIIQQNLSSLKEQFDPVKTGNPELTTYANARASYAKLSQFIDEGSSYLGKITQSGDFAKDSSLLKSSVQSILNNGKKDWLVKLDTLTGNNLLDKAVLALQAMKDAGDFRGLSLLEELSKGIPTSKAGFTQKVLDFAAQKVGNALTGSPADQTRTFLQSLKSQSLDNALPKSIQSSNIKPTIGVKSTPTIAQTSKSTGFTSDTVPSTGTKIKSALKTAAIKGKRGFVANPFKDGLPKAVKQLNNQDKTLMSRYIDSVRLTGEKKPVLTAAEESDLVKLNETLGIHPDQSAETIAKQYEQVIPKIKEPQPRTIEGKYDKTIPKELAPLAKEAQKYKSAEEFVKAQHPNIEWSLHESPEDITLSKIVVPKSSRGTGEGTKAMESLIRYADIKGKRVFLTPSKDFGASSVSRLTDFYKKFGFRENSGRSRDFSTREAMIREPQKPQLTDFYKKVHKK